SSAEVSACRASFTHGALIAQTRRRRQRTELCICCVRYGSRREARELFGRSDLLRSPEWSAWYHTARRRGAMQLIVSCAVALTPGATTSSRGSWVGPHLRFHTGLRRS